MENLQTSSLEDLMGQFENDVRFGGHSYRVEASRSSAGKEIQQRGPTIIPVIEQRIEAMPVSDIPALDERVKSAWRLLLGWLPA